MNSSPTQKKKKKKKKRPFTPQDQPLLLAAGITKVAHLQAALQVQHPQALTACLQSLLLALPLPWQAAATAAPTAPPWRQGHSASGTQLIQNTQTGQQHSVSPHCQLLQAPTQAISISGPMHVTPWDPSRPWRGPAQQPAQSTVALYSQGRLWGPEHFSLHISHMFLECPMAATVIGWLCRLWQAVTGHLPDASVATILVASTSEGHCASDALLQTWHRLRLAVLHSIWTAARIAASSTHTSTQASQSSSQSHLASKLALKTIVSMIRHDWVKCTDDVRQLSGVCSSWLRGRDPSMTLQAFRDLWCHHDALASIHTAHTGTEDKLELVVNLSDMVPVQLF
ncbi:hypothetical protein ABBQ32_008101 [Trebouxia sp. C0010 RCD-2024]